MRREQVSFWEYSTSSLRFWPPAPLDVTFYRRMYVTRPIALQHVEPRPTNKPASARPLSGWRTWPATPGSTLRFLYNKNFLFFCPKLFKSWITWMSTKDGTNVILYDLLISPSLKSITAWPAFYKKFSCWWSMGFWSEMQEIFYRISTGRKHSSTPHFIRNLRVDGWWGFKSKTQEN